MITIKMRMPENCNRCPMLPGPYDMCVLHDGIPAHQTSKTERPEWCPLVEVVRCKDCKHYDSMTESCLNGLDGIFMPDWFCPEGKRRDDDA